MPKKKSTDLVQIQTSPIPPWHQSTESLTSCPKFYVESVIKGRKQPGGMESARGNQVHKTGAAYAAWCAHKGVAMDLDAFDRLSQGAGPTAAKILVGMRESYQVDWNHLLATELPMSLDENFQPTDVVDTLGGVSVDTGLPSCYSGVLDALYMFREEARAICDDLKTHPRPFQPDDTLQAKTYALFIFQHFPWVMEVKFRLIFVRFKNLVREAVFTREEVPVLIEAVKAARARQVMIHADYDASKEIEAIPGAHCVYCPLLSNRGCPISEFNPQMQFEPVDRLKFLLWYSAFSKVNSKTLREYVNGTGKRVVLKDYNGKAYVFGPVESESSVYPLFQATGESIATRCDCGEQFDYVPENGKCPKCKEGRVKPLMPIADLIIEDYAFGNTGDTAWMGKLVISSTKLNSYLGTKKRAFLDQACQDTADKVTKATLKVSKPLDAVPDEEPEEDSEEGEGWSDDSEF
jgi:hypothetical protein